MEDIVVETEQANKQLTPHGRLEIGSEPNAPGIVHVASSSTRGRPRPRPRPHVPPDDSLEVLPAAAKQAYPWSILGAWTLRLSR